MTPVLNVKGMVKRFGGLLATDHVDLTVNPGEIHALIGPNGAGKTTLISQLMGELRQNEGTIELDGVPITSLPTARRVSMGLARTFQITCLLPDYTVLDNVAIAIQVRQGHSFRFWGNVRHEHQLRASARSFLDAAGLADRASELVANLSHGEQKQLELAVALATRPRLLLLDEPMAGLGHVESQQMIEMLRGLRNQVPMLLVEHDMEAVFALADRISVLVYGRIIATGTVDEIRDNPEVRTAYLGEGDELC
ncbi:amino acid/amide ABC transporter ATP-binding protein 1 (HAAT family) [Aminobacter aminovorans]|uniref:Lipopolysaccharide export system ATP-binding protein LptB n=1 Tax=Aminobacter aminovorans TaxID=83263 RepID=A0A380WNN1_AMIAI|nr:ABC transporter ATP-binding protein [Aminobacter aminovorans]TCS25940.1 amino acid/amide ABC transporter ATP-binding protein 1 (HAAT family) [Aminobacter aminovorans]SUU90395.1 Lipopolysaccharide export system ATP-binding protein LptB [Aminobacter aminovorans]